MAEKLTDRTAKTSSFANDDVIHVVDVSDTSQDPAGSSFKSTLGNIYDNFIATKVTSQIAINGVVLDNGSILREGTTDAGAGGGIAQICGVGYELKWEAGSQYVMNNDGTLIREVNHKFNTAPTVTNDDSEGFYVGSRWILDDGTIYTCTDDSTGAAVWKVYPYAVYTALLTQTGSTDPQTITTGTLTVGVTYEITDNSGGANFTNVGAPNNTVGTYFVATGTTPTSWGTGELGYNNGAVTATVLQNTIGNIWYTYNASGVYNIKSDGLFINKKTTFLFGALDGQPGNAAAVVTDQPQNNINNYIFATNDTDGTAGEFLYDTQIEIRVYP